MKKSEAEKAIRHLCHEWAKARGIPNPPSDRPDFRDFKSWLSEKGYSHYLSFRSSISALYDAEAWFDDELNQIWRN